jgi:hypothetical protein
VEQTIQMLGAVIVLAGFVANQRMGLSSDAALFLLANALGTAILTACAAVNHDLGFTVLEGTWAIVSTLSLIRAVRRDRSRIPAG